MTAEKGFYTTRLAARGAVLAPMAGYSDAPFRRLASEHGALWTVSEMMSAQGVVQGAARATGAPDRRDPTLDLGRPYPGERDRVIQLFGADPMVIADAAALIEAMFAPAAIDLNLGCPVPKVRGRGGSCLLQTPEVAYALVRAMRTAVRCDVSAKMRLGWDTDASADLALGLEAAGADLIAVHGRTAAQRYEGRADWDAIARVAGTVQVPVVGSGDVRDTATIRERLRLGVAGVMVARGAIGNPWLFREARGGPPPTETERSAVALRHAELNVACYGERRGLLQLRKVLPAYFPDRPGWRDRLVRVSSMNELRSVLGVEAQAAD